MFSYRLQVVGSLVLKLTLQVRDLPIQRANLNRRRIIYFYSTSIVIIILEQMRMDSKQN